MSEYMEALDAPDVTEEQIMLALVERINEMASHGASFLDPETFFRPGDLDKYRAAAAWWPKDAPPICLLPSLRELCMTIAGGAGTQPIPFADALTLLWTRCVEWLGTEDRSTVHPNETPTERKHRLNRERVRRHRSLHREVHDEDPHVRHVKQLHARYIEACQARKEALAAVHDEHDLIVERARTAWEEAKAAV